jgi:hypothetical protein
LDWLGEPKIEDLHSVILGQKNVRWFQIAVHDAAVMASK